jgi:hypothetical protein
MDWDLTGSPRKCNWQRIPRVAPSADALSLHFSDALA